MLISGWALHLLVLHVHTPKLLWTVSLNRAHLAIFNSLYLSLHKNILYLHDFLLTKLQISDKLDVLRSKSAVTFHDGKYGNLKYEVCYQTPIQCIPLLNIMMFFHFLGLTITTGVCSNPVGEAAESTWKWRWIRLPNAAQFSFDHPLHVLRNSLWSHGFLLVKPAHHFCKRLFHVQCNGRPHPGVL